MMRLIVGSLLILALVVVGLGSVGWLKYRQTEAAMSAPPPPEMPVSVAIAVAEPAEFRQHTVAIGTVLAEQSIELSTEVAGIVAEIPMRPGQIVRCDDLLLRLDTRLEEAQLKSALATQKLTAAGLRRTEKLIRANAGSEQALDEAAAAVQQAEAEVDRLRVMIDMKTLRAPFDARVGLFDVHPGQYLQAGTRITDLSGVSDHFNIDFALPQNVAATIAIDDEVELFSAALPESLRCRIVALDAAANLRSRSLMARARLDDPPQRLHPGDSVQVRAAFGAAVPAVRVPATAICRGPTGTGVFVAENADGTLRARYHPIRVLATGGAIAWVGGGIDAGDHVVTNGSFKVTEGAMLAAADVPVGELTVTGERGEDE